MGRKLYFCKVEIANIGLVAQKIIKRSNIILPNEINIVSLPSKI